MVFHWGGETLQQLVTHPGWPISCVTLSLVSRKNPKKTWDCMLYKSLTNFDVLWSLELKIYSTAAAALSPSQLILHEKYLQFEGSLSS